jgi:hypothetical protein
MELDNVCNPCQAQTQAAYGQSSGYPDISPAFTSSIVNSFVQQPPLCSKPIFFPLFLDVDEGALPFAEKKMLNRRERQKLVLKKHQYF